MQSFFDHVCSGVRVVRQLGHHVVKHYPLLHFVQPRAKMFSQAIHAADMEQLIKCRWSIELQRILASYKIVAGCLIAKLKDTGLQTMAE